MNPQDFRNQLTRALQLFSSGQLAASERLLRELLQAAPGDLNAMNLLAGVKREQGDKEAALALFDAALQRTPGFGAMQFNRADVLQDMGRHDAAVEGYDRAIASGFAGGPVLRARGVSLVALGRLDNAALSFQRAVAADPNDVHSWRNLGGCLQKTERWAEAIAAYDAALKLEPNAPAIWDNRGAAAHQLGRLDEALANYQCALRLDPNRPDTSYNIGLVLSDLGQGPAAIEAFDRALARPTPFVAAIRYNRALAFMRMHDFPPAWPGFDGRWDAGQVGTPRYDRGEPAWRGERVTGTLRIWPEQGIGDQTLFSRLVGLACDRADDVALECRRRLVPLFARSFPGVIVRAFDAEAPPAQAQISLGGLGGAMNVRASDLGGDAYLRADTGKRDALRARYEALAQGRKIVGVAWSSTSPKRGALKTAALDAWSGLLSRDHFFVNLQYGEAALEGDGCGLYREPEVDQLADLDAFAAQLCALDQIVSVSNTTVHMAGALGVPTIVMPPPARGRLWYWGLEGETTPWYASVRIVRRSRDEDWPAQIARAAALTD